MNTGFNSRQKYWCIGFAAKVTIIILNLDLVNIKFTCGADAL